MQRTTIMADDSLLDRLRAIARDEGVSLAEVIREGMELRAQRSRPTVTFVGIGRSGRKGHRTSERGAQIEFQPRTWR
jgi:hypothetical protein